VRAPISDALTRGNTVATLADPYASDASTKARCLDDLDAPVSILRGCTRLRALWGVFPVVVRVHSSACRVIAKRLCAYCVARYERLLGRPRQHRHELHALTCGTGTSTSSASTWDQRASARLEARFDLASMNA
jgi:hypothetical protein